MLVELLFAVLVAAAVFVVPLYWPRLASASGDERPNDLLGVVPGAPSTPIPIRGPLDVNGPWDRMVMDEAGSLSVWTGTAPELLHSPRGTAAASNGKILINREQLESLFGVFGDFTSEKYKTAIFFALAHEFGHLCQYKHLGVNETLVTRPRLLVEAHADLLSGIWLGKRLGDGATHAPDDILAATLRFKERTADYPTAYQRGCLVNEGVGMAVTLWHVIEPQITGANYTPVEAGLRAQDVHDLFGAARRRLDGLPSSAPVVRSKFGALFRRVP